ncbi:MAG: PRC-barrel domain-containing protein [Actinomycetota bacterium]
MHSWLLYHALRQPTESPRRCCTDIPANLLPEDRSSAVRRFATKLPLAFRAFRASLRLPVAHARPEPGTRVVTTSGTHLGRLERLVIALDSGEASAVVSDDLGARGGRVLLLPAAALRPRTEPTALVVDDRVLAESLTGARPAA